MNSTWFRIMTFWQREAQWTLNMLPRLFCGAIVHWPDRFVRIVFCLSLQLSRVGLHCLGAKPSLTGAKESFVNQVTWNQKRGQVSLILLRYSTHARSTVVSSWAEWTSSCLCFTWLGVCWNSYHGLKRVRVLNTVFQKIFPRSSYCHL